jgi:hypothetical protein
LDIQIPSRQGRPKQVPNPNDLNSKPLGLPANLQVVNSRKGETMIKCDIEIIPYF